MYICVHFVAAAHTAATGMGRSIQDCAAEYLSKIDDFVANSIIIFYAKCGTADDSCFEITL